MQGDLTVDAPEAFTTSLQQQHQVHHQQQQAHNASTSTSPRKRPATDSPEKRGKSNKSVRIASQTSQTPRSRNNNNSVDTDADTDFSHAYAFTARAADHASSAVSNPSDADNGTNANANKDTESLLGTSFFNSQPDLSEVYQRLENLERAQLESSKHIQLLQNTVRALESRTAAIAQHPHHPPTSAPTSTNESNNNHAAVAAAAGLAPIVPLFQDDRNNIAVHNPHHHHHHHHHHGNVVDAPKPQSAGDPPTGADDDDSFMLVATQSPNISSSQNVNTHPNHSTPPTAASAPSTIAAANRRGNKVRKPALSKAVRHTIFRMLDLVVLGGHRFHGYSNTPNLPEFTTAHLTNDKGERIWRWDWSKTIRGSSHNAEFAAAVRQTLLQEREQGAWKEVPDTDWIDLDAAIDTSYTNLRREKDSQTNPLKNQKKQEHRARNKRRGLKDEKAKRRKTAWFTLRDNGGGEHEQLRQSANIPHDADILDAFNIQYMSSDESGIEFEDTFIPTSREGSEQHQHSHDSVHPHHPHHRVQVDPLLDVGSLKEDIVASVVNNVDDDHHHHRLDHHTQNKHHHHHHNLADHLSTAAAATADPPRSISPHPQQPSHHHQSASTPSQQPPTPGDSSHNNGGSGSAVPPGNEKIFRVRPPIWRSNSIQYLYAQLDKIKTPERAFKRVMGQVRESHPPPATPLWMVDDSWRAANGL